jgi:hypothetical protein
MYSQILWEHTLGTTVLDDYDLMMTMSVVLKHVVNVTGKGQLL